MIPIFNREGEQIVTMKETVRARPSLICERIKYANENEGGGEVEAEVLGGKGIQIELLHRRLGHTSQSVIDRLVGQYTIGCLYGHLWGMGACAYTINGTGTGIRVLVPCFDTCVGLGATQ